MSKRSDSIAGRKLRRELREQGICLTCETWPVGVNQSGTPSKYCDGCRPSHNAPKPDEPQLPPPTRIVRDSNYDNLDCDLGRAYQAAVALIVTDEDNTHGVGTAEIHRKLTAAGIEVRAEWTLRCIHRITNLEEIVGARMRYRCFKEARTIQREWDWSNMTPVYTHRRHGECTEAQI